MLQNFISANRDAIISRARKQVAGRVWPCTAPGKLDEGVRLFLRQLEETLRVELTRARILGRSHWNDSNRVWRGAVRGRLHALAGGP